MAAEELALLNTCCSSWSPELCRGVPGLSRSLLSSLSLRYAPVQLSQAAGARLQKNQKFSTFMSPSVSQAVSLCEPSRGFLTLSLFRRSAAQQQGPGRSLCRPSSSRADRKRSAYPANTHSQACSSVTSTCVCTETAAHHSMTKFDSEAVAQRGGRAKGNLPSQREQRKEMAKYLKTGRHPGRELAAEASTTVAHARTHQCQRQLHFTFVSQLIWYQIRASAARCRLGPARHRSA